MKQLHRRPHAGLAPRCLDRAGAAEYLGGISEDQVDRLIQAGVLPIVRLPVERHGKTGHGVNGTCRRVLIDVRDLDAIVDRSKETRA